MPQTIRVCSPSTFLAIIDSRRRHYWEASKDEGQSWHPYSVWGSWTIRHEIKWLFRQLDDAFTVEGQARLDLEERRRKQKEDAEIPLGVVDQPVLVCPAKVVARRIPPLRWHYWEASKDDGRTFHRISIWESWPIEDGAQWRLRFLEEANTKEGRIRLDQEERRRKQKVDGGTI